MLSFCPEIGMIPFKHILKHFIILRYKKIILCFKMTDNGVCHRGRNAKICFTRCK